MPRKIADDPKDSAIFSTEVFHSELNKALQRRENNRRQKEFKQKKLLERNHTRNFGKARSETDKFGRGGPPKRKVWFCNVHGNQTDHSTDWCPTLHPEHLQKKAKFIQARNNPLHRVKTEEKETEANMTLSKKSEAVVKFDWVVNFISVNCNLTAADVGSERCIFDTGAGANLYI